MTLSLLAIRDATPAQVAVAYGRAVAGAHDFIRPSILPNMLGRIGHDLPLQIIVDDLGPAGWAGLVRYGDEPTTWESSTFLAPSLRGTGVFEIARCLQTHLVEGLIVDHGSDVRVLTSIDEANARSRAATNRYAAAHGWPTGRLVAEPHKNRTGWVVDWPLPVPHTCLLPGASQALVEVVA